MLTADLPLGWLIVCQFDGFASSANCHYQRNEIDWKMPMKRLHCAAIKRGNSSSLSGRANALFQKRSVQGALECDFEKLQVAKIHLLKKYENVGNTT